MIKPIAICLALTAQALIAQDPPDVEAMKKGQPRDVAQFISRAFGCWHFGGEEPYSPERSKEIQAATRKLKCDRLAKDEARLRRKYRNNPAILKVLDESKSFS